MRVRVQGTAGMLQAKKSLGQHFLTARAVAGSIVSALSPRPGDLVFEIGPGRGALTGPLAASGAAIVAYEIDERLVTDLRAKLASSGNVELRRADIREVDLDAAAAERGSSGFKLAGNIPYNLTSVILIDLARWRRLSEAVVMVQREVGDRILARPGGRGCGILSIFLQSYFIIEKVRRVRPGSFTPPPRVESVVLRFVPLAPGSGPANREAFLLFLKGCFSQRRKKLRNILGEVFGADTAKDLVELGRVSGVDIGMRPEEITLEGWHGLFALFQRMKGLQ